LIQRSHVQNLKNRIQILGFTSGSATHPAILGLISLACFGVIIWQKNGGRKIKNVAFSYFSASLPDE
jgi:hypothetical protein